MKKIERISSVIENLMIAIILGGIYSNIVCITEYYMKSFGIFLLLMAGIAFLSVYFLFMRPGKTIYALACIPSAYLWAEGSVNFWWRVFSHPISWSVNIYKMGVVILLHSSVILCTIVILFIEMFRFRKWLKGKERKHDGI